MSDPILVRVDHGVAAVTLNRPDKKNALNMAMWRELGVIMRDLDADAEIRCIVINGAGGAFSAGADISAFDVERATAEQAVEYGAAEMEGIYGVASCRHPVIASIDGACVGGGLEIAVGCDLRVCTERSTFGVPVSKLGLTMSYEEAEFMAAAVGGRLTLQLLLEGSVMGAERALSLGLVTHQVHHSELERTTTDLVESICAGAPLVHRWHKKFFRRLASGEPLTLDERAEGFAAFDTQDFREGFQAFLDKRRPDFEGR